MQHQVVAEVDGTVAAIVARADTQIAAGVLIFEITPDDEKAA